MNYYFKKTFTGDFDAIIEHTKKELEFEGFGVLFEIDFKEKFKEKLEIDFRKYKILGACNPPYAYSAIQSEDNVGLLLPCNVLIHEISPNTIEVSIIDPEAIMNIVENQKLNTVASSIKDQLKKVINNL